VGYSVWVTMRDGGRIQTVYDRSAAIAAKNAFEHMGSKAAKEGWFTRIAIELEGGGAVWEWQHGKGIVSE
jgi:hypothetical protein